MKMTEDDKRGRGIWGRKTGQKERKGKKKKERGDGRTNVLQCL